MNAEKLDVDSFHHEFCTFWHLVNLGDVLREPKGPRGRPMGVKGTPKDATGSPRQAGKGFLKDLAAKSCLGKYEHTVI